ncbi:polysaccharide biosynthesis C-terminal domain-containing protein [Flammeovirga sp. SJP92]|uniref:polysaccharide biosynthesis C-terminal domain-containing protein n=1 Tax=Flammeovirga sp. SJP92 TaxID=1775430 RepID=UPI0007896F2B|nr:polysaccharide biosynthesis C-terminal domain-containing protein [Flammeovirga sp. SJP92]KXX67238.1 hypothetical protein AVL50_28025 [Flammeovirga sp. SJP92]
MLQKVLSNSFLYGIAPQLVGVVNMLLLPLITPHLTAFDYGLYGVVNAFMVGLGLFQFLGLTIVITNAYYNHPQKYIWIWRKVLGILLIWNFPFVIIQSIVLYFVIPSEAQNNQLVIITLAGLPIFFNSTLTFIGSLYYQLNIKPKALFYRTVGVGLVVASMNYYCIAFLEMGYMGWFYANAVGGILMGISFISLFFRKKLYPVLRPYSKLKPLLKLGTSTLPHHFSAYILDYSDRVLMEFSNVPINAIGRYNLSYSIGDKVFQLSNGVRLAVVPVIVDLFKNNKLQQAQHIIRSLSILFILGTMCISIWTREIFDLLVKNESLKDVYPIAIVIIITMNYRPYFLLSTSILEFKEKTKFLSHLSIGVTVFNVVANLLLLPFFGIMGAAIATFISYLVYGFISFFLPISTLKGFNKLEILFTMIVILGVLFLSLEIVEFTVLVKGVLTIMVGVMITAIYFKSSWFKHV